MAGTARISRRTSTEIDLVDVRDPSMPMVRGISGRLRAFGTVDVEVEVEISVADLLVAEKGRAELREHPRTIRLAPFTGIAWDHPRFPDLGDEEAIAFLIAAAMEGMEAGFPPLTPPTPASPEGQQARGRALEAAFRLLGFADFEVEGESAGLRVRPYGTSAFVLGGEDCASSSDWFHVRLLTEGSRIMGEVMKELGFDTGRVVEFDKSGLAFAAERAATFHNGEPSAHETLDAEAEAQAALDARPDLVRDAGKLLAWCRERDEEPLLPFRLL
ncbi:hypothetical protein WV31_19210 [Magnetospirillum sp. ME-1]|uniref:hypothetical protein n=1 Tax=Magnetospirillum sp. ME-1 TaxID=1639348 RepID=UPI000A17BF45|nr:hypothetical protein [Magnetospirillum sp. ME-1]ARJ67631.1 hypothetical protein WV31_19210 [Magnetospirillum sp. ME-1]